MLKAEDPVTGRRMSPTDLLHNVQFFIVAGHETTALALSWSLLLLALYPKAQERAREEAGLGIHLRRHVGEEEHLTVAGAGDERQLLALVHELETRIAHSVLAAHRFEVFLPALAVGRGPVPDPIRTGRFLFAAVVHLDRVAKFE